MKRWIESATGHKFKITLDMKKLFLAVMMFIGFIMTVSESANFLPNIIGLCLMVCSADNLHMFETNKK